jgi:AcrR family transcriptional regulator
VTTTPRRTQAQRREGTITALLDATVRCLTERGYAATSTAAVCAEAGVSQGALFRHFPTRQALLVATAEHVATRNVEAFRATTEGVAVGTADDVAAVLGHLRTAVLSPANQTWRELLVAARSDADLRTALLPARESLQAQMLDAAADLWRDRLPAEDLPAVLSIVVNMLDGLAFSALDPDPTAAPGRTVERALRLLAEMVVSHYPQEP